MTYYRRSASMWMILLIGFAVSVWSLSPARAGSAVTVIVTPLDPLVQIVPLNAQVPQPFRVVVTANGQPVAGLDVTFANGPCYYSDVFCPPVDPSLYGRFVNGSNNVDATTDAAGAASSSAFVTGSGYGVPSYIHTFVVPQVVDGVSYVESATDVHAPMTVWQGVESVGGGPAVSAPTLHASILGLLALALWAIAAYEGQKRTRQ